MVGGFDIQKATTTKNVGFWKFPASFAPWERQHSNQQSKYHALLVCGGCVSKVSSWRITFRETKEIIIKRPTHHRVIAFCSYNKAQPREQPCEVQPGGDQNHPTFPQLHFPSPQSNNHTRMDPTPNPRVGVAVFVLNSEGKFIVGKRKGSHGAGTWSALGAWRELTACRYLGSTGRPPGIW